jgi:hypothetical protein
MWAAEPTHRAQHIGLPEGPNTSVSAPVRYIHATREQAARLRPP